MAWHLVSLRLALLRATVRRGKTSALLGLAAAYLAAVGFGAIGGLVLLTLRAASLETRTGVSAAVLLLLTLLWALGPLMALAADNSLDVDRLALFPLTARDLMPGLLLAAAVSPGGVFTVLVVLGLFAGTAPAGVGVVVSVIAVGAALALCIALSRLVSTTLSAAVGKRRWRDIALFAGPVLALGSNVGFQLLSRRFSQPDASAEEQSEALRNAGRVARWLPTGWAAEAVRAADEGAYALAVLASAATLLLVFGAMTLWWRSIQAATTQAVERSVSTRRTRTALMPRLVSWLPANAVGAIAAKDLRYSWRDPRRRAALMGLGFAAVVPLIAFRGLTDAGARLVLLAAWPALNLATNSNVFGFDADRIWVDVSAGVPLRSQLVARAASRLTYSAPAVAAILVAFVAIAGSADNVAPALGLIVAVTGVGYGLGAIASVRTPVAMPDETKSNIFGTSGGQNAAAGGAALGVLLATGAIALPLVIATLVLPADSVAQFVVGALGVAVGVGVWLLSLRATTPARPGAEADLLARLVRD